VTDGWTDGHGSKALASALVGYRAAGSRAGPVLPEFNWRPVGEGALEAVYDLPNLRAHVDRDRVVRGRGQWDWQFLLPVLDPDKIVTLHEGATPLIQTRRIGDALGLRRLYVKDESRNPTGSFKDRGASVTVSKCREVAMNGLTVASSGNLAAALATYAAAARLTFCGFIRDDTTEVHRLQCLATGQPIFVVEGGMLEGTKLATEVSTRFHLFHALQPYNAFRIEGKKTIAFEICRDLGWQAPHRVLIPTSGCTNVLALYKGFRELQDLGWIERMPALDVVQPTGCAPIAQAWQMDSRVQRCVGPGTALVGLGHPFPAAGDAAVEIIRRTGGRCLTVSDDEAFNAQGRVLANEGLFFQPASVTPIAALANPRYDEFRSELRDQTVVWIGTGSGKNQITEPLARHAPPPRITGGIDEFARLNPSLAVR
jgi:threonine synthase